MIAVRLDPPNERLDVVGALPYLPLAHLLEGPLGELGDGVARHLPQRRVVAGGRPVDEGVEEGLHLGVLVEAAAREPPDDLEDQGLKEGARDLLGVAGEGDNDGEEFGVELSVGGWVIFRNGFGFGGIRTDHEN